MRAEEEIEGIKLIPGVEDDCQIIGRIGELVHCRVLTGALAPDIKPGNEILIQVNCPTVHENDIVLCWGHYGVKIGRITQIEPGSGSYDTEGQLYLQRTKGKAWDDNDVDYLEVKKSECVGRIIFAGHFIKPQKPRPDRVIGLQ